MAWHKAPGGVSTPRVPTPKPSMPSITVPKTATSAHHGSHIPKPGHTGLHHLGQHHVGHHSGNHAGHHRKGKQHV